MAKYQNLKYRQLTTPMTDRQAIAIALTILDHHISRFDPHCLQVGLNSEIITARRHLAAMRKRETNGR